MVPDPPAPVLPRGDVAFEALEQTNGHGAEFWNGRDLQPLLGYTQWRHFEKAIERSCISCAKSENDPSHHSAGAGKMVTLGVGTVREVPEFHLSRFACYLIAQNGDPNPPGGGQGSSSTTTTIAGSSPESSAWTQSS